MRSLWFACGVAAMLLAVIGVFLPVFPTVPFLILAAICFAKSSRKAYKWLMNHDKFGPPIKAWQERGAISRRAKWAGTLAMAAAVLISLSLGLPEWLVLLQTVTVFGVALFMWTRPDA